MLVGPTLPQGMKDVLYKLSPRALEPRLGNQQEMKAQEFWAQVPVACSVMLRSEGEAYSSRPCLKVRTWTQYMHFPGSHFTCHTGSGMAQGLPAASQLGRWRLTQQLAGQCPPESQGITQHSPPQPVRPATGVTQGHFFLTVGFFRPFSIIQLRKKIPCIQISQRGRGHLLSTLYRDSQ